MHKAVVTLLKLYPRSQDYEKATIFDKNFLLFSILNARNYNSEQAHSEIEMQNNYCLEADKLLQNGGVAHKTVKHVTEKSRLIKEMITKRIR